jgi:hypothetical protein
MMNSFKFKGRSAQATGADKKSETTKADQVAPQAQRVQIKPARGIYSSARNLDSNFRC